MGGITMGTRGGQFIVPCQTGKAYSNNGYRDDVFWGCGNIKNDLWHLACWRRQKKVCEANMGCVNVSIVLLSLCGVALSYYAVHIAAAIESDKNFQPTCDLDETISCSHALLSDYSKGFGIIGKILGEDHILNLPNSYMGLIFFPLMLILALSSSAIFLYLALFLTFASTITSAYLLYVLVYVLETICLVCFPVHVINMLLFILFTLKWRTSDSEKTQAAATKSKKKN